VDSRPTDRLEALTGLRFAAALGILLFHHGGPLLSGTAALLSDLLSVTGLAALGSGLPSGVDPSASVHWAERVRAGGHVWVGLFYVLSGFVLARAHPAPLGPAERRAFWAGRIARLYPAYLLAFVLAAPFALERWADGGPLASGKAAAVALASLLLVQAWIPPVARLWNAPGWSTSVIVAFYAAFPFVAGRLSRLSRRRLWIALGCSWALSLAFPLAWLWWGPGGAGSEVTWDEPPWLMALKFHPVARAGEFLAGVALGLLHRRGMRLTLGAPLAAPLAFVAAAAVLASGAAPYVLLHNGLLVPLFAVGIISLAQGTGPLARALGSAPLRALGEASFALYALQEPLWLWARRLAGGPQGAPSPAFVLAYSAATIAIALAVSRTVEQPVRRAIRAALGGSPAPGAARIPLARGERDGA
jgi:peptidoglycan/LPS O-acetylase OafA/YrhL